MRWFEAMRPFLQFFCLAGLLLSARSALLENHSFKAPFTEVDHLGGRVASRHWRSSGTTVVNTNFIRLTPDRQSKKGALWSKRSLGVADFSAILKFRISGQGKNFFGDGIGMWIVQQGYFSEGVIHGFQEKFVGIGIIFDTFKNTENYATHRDVTVLINDGDKTYEAMTEVVQGCNTYIRYHAERADFSVTDASRAKVVLDKESFSIFIDSRNSGTWTECVRIEQTGLPAGWAENAHIGLTATTGQLADNHDILSLQTFSDQRIMEMVENIEKKTANTHFSLDANVEPKENMMKIANQLNSLIGQMNFLDHHLEHEFAALTDSVRNMLGKLNDREDQSEDRIERLEEIVKKEVEASLDSRLSVLDSNVRGNVERKMSTIQSSLDKKLMDLESEAEQFRSKHAGSWIIPFMILAVIIFGAAVFMYLFYRRIIKMHLL